MTEKIKCTLTCELVEVFVSREDAIESLMESVREGIYGREQYIIARNMFASYQPNQWAVYQIITVGNEEVI